MSKDVFEIMKQHKLMLGLWGNRTDLAAQQRIGRELKNKRDRVFGSYKIIYAGKDRRTKNATYMLTEQGRELLEHPQTPARAHCEKDLLEENTHSYMEKGLITSGMHDEIENAVFEGVEGLASSVKHIDGRRRGKI